MCKYRYRFTLPAHVASEQAVKESVEILFGKDAEIVWMEDGRVQIEIGTRIVGKPLLTQKDTYKVKRQN